MRIRIPQRSTTRSTDLSVDQYANLLNFGGNTYPLGMNYTLQNQRQEMPTGWDGLVRGVYMRNPVVFGCMRARMDLFSQARFQWQNIRNGKPGDLFGTQDLVVLEKPWQNGTTRDLLVRAIQDADLTGNFYAVRRGDTLHRLCPEYVTIIIGDPADPAEEPSYDSQVLGYWYKEPNREGEAFMVEEVAHWAPIPDPLAKFRGMSWLTPVLRDILADNAATEHKLKFFEQGATPNLVVTLDPSVRAEQYERWMKIFEEKYGGGQGIRDAYKTMYLGGGAEAKVVGADLRQISFAETQGKGETRIALAAGVPPIVAGLSEGLQASTFSNFREAMQKFGDMTGQPLWEGFAAAMSTVVAPPRTNPAAQLVMDRRFIGILREDRNDAATIQATKAATINTFVTAGFTPDSAIAAVEADDNSLLVATGLVSVQLFPPGQTPNANTPGTSTPPGTASVGTAKPPRSAGEVLAPFIRTEEQT